MQKKISFLIIWEKAVPNIYKEINQFVTVLGTLSGRTAPDVSNIVCHFYGVNENVFNKEEGVSM